MPGQEPPLKLFINFMKAALESLKFLQEYSDLPREYLLDLGERLFQYFDNFEESIRLQCNLLKKYKRKFKSRYIPEFSYPPRTILPMGYAIQNRDNYLCDPLQEFAHDNCRGYSCIDIPIKDSMYE